MATAVVHTRLSLGTCRVQLRIGETYVIAADQETGGEYEVALGWLAIRPAAARPAAAMSAALDAAPSGTDAAPSEQP